MSHNEGAEIWDRVERLQAQHREGRTDAAGYREGMQALWEQLRTDEEGAGAVMEQILAATATEVQGQLAPQEYRRRIQTIWARWLAGGTIDE